MPENIKLHNPSRYGEDKLDKILAVADSLSFALHSLEDAVDEADEGVDDTVGGKEEARDYGVQGRSIEDSGRDGGDDEAGENNVDGGSCVDKGNGSQRNGASGVNDCREKDGVGMRTRKTNAGKRKATNTDVGEFSGGKRKRVGVREGKQCGKKQPAARKSQKWDEKCNALVCQEPFSMQEEVFWVFCNTCEEWFHWECVGIHKEPTGQYDCGCSIPIEARFAEINKSLLIPDLSKSEKELRVS